MIHETKKEEIQKAGIYAIPGTGFDIVPTDCLAAMLSKQLTGAKWLYLAFKGKDKGGMSTSTGTTKTMVHSVSHCIITVGD